MYLFFDVLGLHCCEGFSLVLARDTLYLGCRGFSLWWLFLLQSKGSRAQGLQQLQLQGSRAQAQQLWSISLVVPWHVESSWTRDQTSVSCIGR